MGCSASKDGRRTVREHDDVTQKKNGGGRNNRRPSLEELEAKEEQQRKRLLMEEAALEQKLQELSLPMFNSGSSTEDLTRLSKVELLAMDKIRRKQRREAAMENASKDRKWMVFSDIEVFSEDEIEILADFLDTILNDVPQNYWHQQQHIFFSEALDSSDLDTSTIDISRNNSTSSITSITTTDTNISLRRSLSGRNQLMGLQELRVHVKSPKKELNGELMDFRLHGPIDANAARDIVELYRQGGKLNMHSVHKILRLAYKDLKELPNTTNIRLNEDMFEKNERLNVVGDIHGQLQDLLHIIDEAGLPSEQNRYIFNGDFVDRGSNSVEVMCILLVLFLAHPKHVVLNRGNHEDFPICCAYGFQQEVYHKYDELTFGMFCELFRHLPLFAVINDSILVLHGGLFHSQAKLAELDEINRHDFCLREVSEPLMRENMEPQSEKEERLNMLQRDALWSDPQLAPGIGPNSRGAGVSFGADVVDTFLRLNNLKLVVRSHECVSAGFDMPFAELGSHTLCTVFSASNYGGRNYGAYMQFKHVDKYNDHSVKIDETDLCFNVFKYNVIEQVRSSSPTLGELESTKVSSSISTLVTKKIKSLLKSFEAVDEKKDGWISIDTWALILSDVTKLNIRWVIMVHTLVPIEGIRSTDDCDQVNFRMFLQSASDKHFKEEENDVLVNGNMGCTLLDPDMALDALYSQHHTIETIYHFFDVSETGYIEREDFVRGMAILNEVLPKGKAIQNIDQIFELMDIDSSSKINMNELFEIFRIVDEKSSKTKHQTSSKLTRQSASTKTKRHRADSDSNVDVLILGDESHAITIKIDSDREECLSQQSTQMILPPSPYPRTSSPLAAVKEQELEQAQTVKGVDPPSPPGSI